jgi:hypothetical protein
MVVLTLSTPKNHPENFTPEKWSLFYIQQLRSNAKVNPGEQDFGKKMELIEIAVECLNAEPTLRPSAPAIEARLRA